MTQARSAPELRLRTLHGEKAKRDVRPNIHQKMDGLTLLRCLGSNSASLVIFDPQYRAILNHQKYGNEGLKREKRRAALKALSTDEIMQWVRQAERVLRPSGHLAIWLDKFTLSEGMHFEWTAHAHALQRVDLFIWNKGRNGMGRRGRCRWEACMLFQKKPLRAKGVWTDHSFDDCFPETADRSSHPHAKPLQFTTRLIKACTKRGDLVVDPCAGSYVTLDACEHTGRVFVGCDLI